ncbi:hypothetical protein SAY87_000088 [Trapa incisa]|uniref:Uncharacterized protein n=1 Tax=Trapa incisa TaxID=236973 RepID=A0AAN7JGC6_9MYRT|nr:hypothetical protein SAY87_000088 [Trapa incisa]
MQNFIQKDRRLIERDSEMRGDWGGAGAQMISLVVSHRNLCRSCVDETLSLSLTFHSDETQCDGLILYRDRRRLWNSVEVINADGVDAGGHYHAFSCFLS